MSKLFKLREWLNLDEACRYLSLLLEEDVEIADVVRLGLDGHLRLSVRFANPAYAKCGKLVPIGEATFKDVPSLFGEGVVRLYGGPRIYSGNDAIYVVDLQDEIFRIEGVYRLSMMGAEKKDVEHYYEQLTSGFEITSVMLDGVLLEGRDGLMYQLLEVAKYRGYEQDNGIDERTKQSVSRLMSRALTERTHPAPCLPDDSTIVVLSEDLRSFEDSLQDTQDNVPTELSQRAETTYLNVIAALLDCIAGNLPNIQRHPSFPSEAKLIEAIDDHFRGYAGLSKSNLQRKFPEAKRTLKSQ